MGSIMKLGCTALVVVAASVTQPLLVAAQLDLPRDLEIELALSTLPSYLRDDATVYVFRPGEGLVPVREGTNGFHALVSRLEPASFRGDWAYERHPDDVLLPIAFDAAGAAENGPIQPFLDAAELLAQGASPAETKHAMRQRFDSGVYLPAERAGVSFMLAPVMRAYPDPVRSDRVLTLNIPHRMFYAPGVENGDIGGNARAGTQPFVIQPGPHGYIGQRAGPVEVASINEEFAEMIRRLCQLRTSLCLESGSP